MNEGDTADLPDELRDDRATGVVLMLDDGEESERIEKEFASAGIPHAKSRLAGEGYRVERPAVWFRVKGRPFLVERADAIRTEFLHRFAESGAER